MNATAPGAAPASCYKMPPLWVLALLTFSSTVPMHLFVPALPAAAKALNATPAAMEGTIGFYVVGLAIGQLLHGPASDRFSRRPVLLVALLMFALSSLACFFANDVRILMLFRLLQALGGSSGLVIARAAVRDTSKTADASRRLALMNLITVLGPGVAPLFGTVVVTNFGWRSIFVFLFVLAVLNLMLVLLRLPETESRPPAVGSSMRSYAVLLRSRRFLCVTLGGSCATTSIYAFISAAPFILSGQLCASPTATGCALTAPLAGIWVGSWLASRLAPQVTVSARLLRANLISLGAALLFEAASFAGVLSISVVMVTMFAFTVGAGITSPTALGEAMAVNGRVAGSASGFYGFTQMVIGAGCTALAGLGSDPALSVGLILLGTAAISQISFRLVLRTPNKAFWIGLERV